MNNIYQYLLIFISLIFSACSLKVDSITDILATDYIEIDDVPEDAIKFTCDENKHFYLKYINDKKSIWIIYPKRGLRLDNTNDPNIYSNGITTLEIIPNNTVVKDDSGLLYEHCIEKL